MASASYFEVILSPVMKATQVEPEEAAVLVLAPFTKPPRLDFKNVEVGLVMKRQLIIRNPGDVRVKVELVKVPSIEKGFTFSTTQLELQPHSEEVIEIAWTPVEDGSWRFVVGVRTTCTLKMDIIIICTSMKKTLAQKKKQQPLTWAQSLPRISRSNKSDEVATKIGSHDHKNALESSIVSSTAGHRWTCVPSHSMKRVSPYSRHVNISHKTLFEEQVQQNVATDITQEHGISCHQDKILHDREEMKREKEIFSTPLKSQHSLKVDELQSVGRRDSINGRNNIERSRHMSRLLDDELPEMNFVCDNFSFSPLGQPINMPKSISGPVSLKSSKFENLQIDLPLSDNPSSSLRQTTSDFVPSSPEMDRSRKETRNKKLRGICETSDLSIILSEDFTVSLNENKPNEISGGTCPVKSPNYLQDFLEFDNIRLSSEIKSNVILQNSQNCVRNTSEFSQTPKSCCKSDVYQFTPVQHNARHTGGELNTEATCSNISCTVPGEYCGEFSAKCQDLEFQASKGITHSERDPYFVSFHPEHGKHHSLDSPVLLTNHHPEDVHSSVSQIEPDLNSSLWHYTDKIFDVRSSHQDYPFTPLDLTNKTEISPQRKLLKPALFQALRDPSTTTQNINCVSKSAELSCFEEHIESSLLSCKNTSKSNPTFSSGKFEEKRIDALHVSDNMALMTCKSSNIGTETSNFVKSSVELTENSLNKNTIPVAAEKVENNILLDVTKDIPESLSTRIPRKMFEIRNNADRLGECQSSPRQRLKDISHVTNIENLNINNNAVETPNTFSFNKPNAMTKTIKKPASSNRSTKDHPAIYLEFSPLKQKLKENEVNSPGKPVFKQVQTPHSKGPQIRGTETVKAIRKRKPRVVPIQRLILLSTKKSMKPEKSKLHDPDEFLSDITNPKNSISTSVVNPFLRSSIYYDEKWFDERAKEFIKWLNYLLTPPEQLTSSDQLPQVDVADLWNKCCKEDVAPAPSRETVSSLYHTSHRLDSLRRAARSLFQSSDVSEVLSKVLIHIDKGILSVRQDLDLHLDVGMKQNVVRLILCYNPLWLRIGLETIYGKKVLLESNSDAVGLVAFIVHNLLSDPYLVQQYSHKGVLHSYKPGFETAMKKFILKKFLFLVYFLDYAKEKKLIPHDPCLFCKDAMYKESRDILLAFARDHLSGIGDITKHLRNLGYVVVHKQTYLHEYNYAVTFLGSDLRDGIRLVRVMEIILQKPELSVNLRAPAVSKLQKIHNVRIVFQALKEAGFELEGNILPKDIAEGHKEKTLSLLWQIIYKFQAPHFSASAAKIQSWWHKISLKMEINKRICMRKTLEAKAKACVTIQKCWRGFLERKRYKRAKTAIIKLQARWRSLVLTKKVRSEYLTKRKAIIQLQSLCRGYLLRIKFLELKKEAAAYRIQTWYRRILVIHKLNLIISLYKAYCEEKEKQHNAAVLIQKWYRRLLSVRKLKATICLYKIYCEEIKGKIFSAVVIQRWYRKQLTVRRLNATISLYRTFCREAKKRSHAAIVIQRHYRRVIEKRRNQVMSAIKIQAVWRGYTVRKNTTIRSCQEKTKLMDQDNSLRKRYTSALVNWLPSKSFGELLVFVQVIDTVTRLSRELCEEVSSTECLEMLFATMRQCNRSIPASEVLEFSTSILVNLVKHVDSMENVWKANTIKILLQLMNCWCGKSSVIFSNCCTVLWLLAQDPHKAETILEIENMKSLLIKFHEMEKRRSKSGKSVQRRGACSSATETKGQKFKLPDITPEWKLAKRNNPRTFEDPFFAISSLVKKMGLKLD